MILFGENVEGYTIPVLNEREIRAAAGRREIRRQSWFLCGLDARAAFSRLWRPLSEPLGDRGGGGGGDAEYRRAGGVLRDAAAPSGADCRGMGGERQTDQRAGGGCGGLGLAPG